MAAPIQSRKYEIPAFLKGTISQELYERWLRRKAVAHVRRDRKRGNSAAIGEKYREEIHRAVKESLGLDHYTGEKLSWSLISSYNNVESQEKKRKYKAELAMLPTVDHVEDGLGEPSFRICAWRTNDAKNDLSYLDFVALCRRVIEHFERSDSQQFA